MVCGRCAGLWLQLKISAHHLKSVLAGTRTLCSLSSAPSRCTLSSTRVKDHPFWLHVIVYKFLPRLTARLSDEDLVFILQVDRLQLVRHRQGNLLGKESLLRTTCPMPCSFAAPTTSGVAKASQTTSGSLAEQASKTRMQSPVRLF
jgi:hypothetical protein